MPLDAMLGVHILIAVQEGPRSGSLCAGAPTHSLALQTDQVMALEPYEATFARIGLGVFQVPVFA